MVLYGSSVLDALEEICCDAEAVSKISNSCSILSLSAPRSARQQHHLRVLIEAVLSQNPQQTADTHLPSHQHTVTVLVFLVLAVNLLQNFHIFQPIKGSLA